jgi:hypothetical protein
MKKSVKKRMKLYTKRALSLIVITVLALTLFSAPVSVLAVLGTPTVSDYTVVVDQEVTVSGAAGEVTSGSEVRVFWDIAVGSGAWQIGSDTAGAAGDYEVRLQYLPM